MVVVDLLLVVVEEVLEDLLVVMELSGMVGMVVIMVAVEVGEPVIQEVLDQEVEMELVVLCVSFGVQEDHTQIMPLDSTDTMTYNDLVLLR